MRKISIPFATLNVSRLRICLNLKIDFVRSGQSFAAGWGGGAVDAGCVEAFLAAALSRVMRAAVPIPAVTAASVSHSAAVGGSVVGVVGLL